MRRGALLAAAALLVFAACEGGDEGGASTTTSEGPTTTEGQATTTTSAPDPFSVPDDPADIDEAYVEAVLTELERINGDALRLAVREGLSPRITELITSIHSPESAALELQAYAIQSSEGFPGTRATPGDASIDVTSLLVATSSCVSADALIDYGDVSNNSTEPIGIRIELRPQTPQAPGNTTPWVYWQRDVREPSTPFPEPCLPL